jgi:glycosyltransferase involved in cell wall biosynthesis
MPKVNEASSASQHGKKLPISVAMVICNEEALLGRALNSCVDLVQEIIIVHDGPCKDRSLEIARRYSAKVFVRDKIGAPEPHRPFTFSKASCNWILQLDADEYLQADFRQALPRLLRDEVTGYTVNWMEEQGDKIYFNMVKEVLFQKDKVSFIGAPCEYIKPLAGCEKLQHVDVGLVNSSQQSNYDSWTFYKAKYGKLARIQAALYAKPFDHLAVWNFPGKSWDVATRFKIAHPLVLGVIGMNLRYAGEWLKSLFRHSRTVSQRAVVHLMWYNTVLYWNLFSLTSRI